MIPLAMFSPLIIHVRWNHWKSPLSLMRKLEGIYSECGVRLITFQYVAQGQVGEGRGGGPGQGQEEDRALDLGQVPGWVVGVGIGYKVVSVRCEERRWWCQQDSLHWVRISWLQSSGLPSEISVTVLALHHVIVISLKFDAHQAPDSTSVLVRLKITAGSPKWPITDYSPGNITDHITLLPAIHITTWKSLSIFSGPRPRPHRSCSLSFTNARVSLSVECRYDSECWDLCWILRGTLGIGINNRGDIFCSK